MLDTLLQVMVQSCKLIAYRQLVMVHMRGHCTAGPAGLRAVSLYERMQRWSSREADLAQMLLESALLIGQACWSDNRFPEHLQGQRQAVKMAPQPHGSSVTPLV